MSASNFAIVHGEIASLLHLAMELGGENVQPLYLTQCFSFGQLVLFHFSVIQLPVAALTARNIAVCLC